MKLLIISGLITSSLIFLSMLVSAHQSNHWNSFQDKMRVGQLCKYYPNESYLIVEILKIDEDEDVVFVQDKSERLWKVQKSSLYPI